MSNVLSKDFLYYYRIWIKEGLDIQTEKLHLDLFDEKTSRKCSRCAQLFVIAKKFKNEKWVCDICFKIVDNIDKEGKMYVIWLNNSKYRVYTNLWRSFADETIRKEGVVDKDGNIDVNKYDWKIPIL